MNGEDRTLRLDSGATWQGDVEERDASTHCAGSRELFSELYERHSRRLFKAIMAITKNPADAEDALQDTFLRGYLGFHRFEGRSSVHSWLMRIAINSALMVLRKRRSRAEIMFAAESDGSLETVCFEVMDSALNPEEICALRQRQRRIQLAVRQLDPHLREAILMRVTQERSIKEIGRTLNISEAAVKTRIHRARAKLAHADRGKAKMSNGAASS